jgi:hypothetical protein
MQAPVLSLIHQDPSRGCSQGRPAGCRSPAAAIAHEAPPREAPPLKGPPPEAPQA